MRATACYQYLIAVLIVFCLTSAGFSQDSRASRSELPEILVVAPAIIDGNFVDRYAGEKTVVTEEQISDLNAQDIASALRMAPGVNITRYNPVGSFGGATGGALFIRGMGSSRPGAEIKTLVDGIPMYMSVWNHPLLDLMSIDPAHSIEVYKSPQPYIFGNAFAVVNMVPRRKDTEGYVSKLEVAGGSFGTFIEKAEHGGKKGNLDYYVGGGVRTSQGHRDNADGSLKDIYGRIGYRLTDNWSTSFFTLANDNYADDPGREGANPSMRQGRYETRSWLASVKLENRFDIAKGYLQLYQNIGNGNWLNQPTGNPGVLRNQYNDFTFYGMKARESFRLWNGGEIITGADWDVTKGKYDQYLTSGSQNNWNGHDFTILSPYTAVSHQFGNPDGVHVIPSAGVRYYNNSDFDSEWSPHAGLVLRYKATEFHAGYSRGVVYPGLDVVVMSEKVTPALGKSWQKLKPETVDHFDVGVRQRFSTLAAVDITYFRDEGKNRYVVVAPPPFPPVFANIEEYRIQGVEATLSLYPLENLSLFTGLTYLDTNPSDLPYAPKITASAGMNARLFNAFTLSLDCQYLDEMYVDSQARRTGVINSTQANGYFLINAKLSYPFFSNELKRKAVVFLAGENLTNTNYEYLPGYPMPGISAMIGLNFTM